MANAKEIEARINKFSQLATLTQTEKDDLKLLAPVWEQYNVLLDKAINLNSENISSEEFTEHLLTDGLKETNDKLGEIVKRLVLFNLDVADEARAESDQMYKSSRSVTFGIMIAAVLISIGFGYVISRMVASPLNRMVKLVGQVAKGDLSETSDIHTKDEIGILATSVNDMVLNLRGTVGGILVSAESVSAASQQISASTEEIASGSMSQANAAQTMNELFRELSMAINSVARSAEQASDLSNQTMSIAQEGARSFKPPLAG